MLLHTYIDARNLTEWPVKRLLVDCTRRCYDNKRKQKLSRIIMQLMLKRTMRQQQTE